VNSQTFDVGDAIRFGWETTKANLNLVIVLAFVGLVATGLPSAIAEWVVRGSPGLAMLFQLIGGIVSLVVGIGATRISLRLHDGGSATVGDLFAVDGPLLWRYFLASLLYGVVVTVGLVLLIIPGIIFSVRYIFYGYAVVDRNARPGEALSQSAAATKGVWGDLSLFGLAIILLNILGALLLGVGLLVTIPISAIATAWVYRRLTGTGPATTPSATGNGLFM